MTSPTRVVFDQALAICKQELTLAADQAGQVPPGTVWSALLDLCAAALIKPSSLPDKLQGLLADARARDEVVRRGSPQAGYRLDTLITNLELAAS